LHYTVATNTTVAYSAYTSVSYRSEGMLVSLISLTVCMHGADKCIYTLAYLFESRNQSVSKIWVLYVYN